MKIRRTWVGLLLLRQEEEEGRMEPRVTGRPVEVRERVGEDRGEC